MCCSFSPTDLKLATCSDDGTVRIWDFMRCKEERVLRGEWGLLTGGEGVSPGEKGVSPGQRRACPQGREERVARAEKGVSPGGRMACPQGMEKAAIREVSSEVRGNVFSGG